MLSTTQFSKKIITWYQKSGRTTLPWQKNQTPYRVWVSEIMLQQTQVATVIPYYERFMQRFPTLTALATAPLDEALHYWSGLGYYARGRNLHRAAQIIHAEYHGRFPTDIDKLIQLPGIGRSTAGAILSLAKNISAPILDGNVKRVLTRCFAIPGFPEKTATLKTLWELAGKHTPQEQCRDYNQAIMDIGALICTRTKPQCTRCPLEQYCIAHKNNSEEEFPHKKPKKTNPKKNTLMLILKNKKGEILLLRRPDVGIWGGLWSFPEHHTKNQLEQFCKMHYSCAPITQKILPKIQHIFSHFTLSITPILLTVKTSKHSIMDSDRQIWYNTQQVPPGGIPAPIAKLIQQIGDYA